MNARDVSQDDGTDDPSGCPLVLTCDTGATARMSLLFAGACAIGAGYGAYSISRGPMDWGRDGPILAIFLYVFPAIAAVLLLGSVVATVRWRKQGKTTLRIPRGYAIEGDLLKGTIECVRTLELIGPARATLECTESQTVRSGSKTRTHTRQVWAEEVALEPAPLPPISARNRAAANEGTCFALEIRVPGIRRVRDHAPTQPGVASERASLRWKLTVAAPTRGLDHESSFDVPILSRRDAQDDGE